MTPEIFGCEIVFSLPFSKQGQCTLRTDYELLFKKYSIAFLVLFLDSRYSKMTPKLVKVARLDFFGGIPPEFEH